MRCTISIATVDFILKENLTTNWKKPYDRLKTLRPTEKNFMADWKPYDLYDVVNDIWGVSCMYSLFLVTPAASQWDKDLSVDSAIPGLYIS